MTTSRTKEEFQSLQISIRHDISSLEDQIAAVKRMMTALPEGEHAALERRIVTYQEMIDRMRVRLAHLEPPADMAEPDFPTTEEMKAGCEKLAEKLEQAARGAKKAQSDPLFATEPAPKDPPKHTPEIVVLCILLMIPGVMMHSWVLWLLVGMYGPVLNLSATWTQSVAATCLIHYILGPLRGKPDTPASLGATFFAWFQSMVTCLIGLGMFWFVWFILVR